MCAVDTMFLLLYYIGIKGTFRMVVYTWWKKINVHYNYCNRFNNNNIIHLCRDCRAQTAIIYIPTIILLYAYRLSIEVSMQRWTCIDMYQRSFRMTVITISVSSAWLFDPFREIDRNVIHFMKQTFIFYTSLNYTTYGLLPKWTRTSSRTELDP